MRLERHEEPSETRDRAAAFGTLCHWWKETGITNPPWADPRDTVCLNKKLRESGTVAAEWWPLGGGEHEVTFAIQLSDAYLHLFADYKGPSTADEWKKAFPKEQYLTGSIDWLSYDGVAWVDDLKTGRWPVNVMTSKQLLSYLLVPWIVQGAPLLGWEGLVTITQWPKYPLAGEPKRSKVRRVSGIELAEHLEDIRWSVSNTDEVNPTEEHCRFCPCALSCDGFSVMASTHLWS